MLERMLTRCRTYSDAMIEEEEGTASSSSSDGNNNNSNAPHPPPEPTIVTFNSVVHAIARSGARDAGHLAEEAWDRMERCREECCAAERSSDWCYEGVLPNARTLA